MVDLATLEREAEAAERRAAALRKFAEVARDLGDDGLAEIVALIAPPPPEAANGHSNGNGNGNHAEPEVPSGRAAVRAIVKERPGIWTILELRDEMISRGWFTTDKGLEAAISRLTRVNKEGKRVGVGRYVFPANYGELPAMTTPDVQSMLDGKEDAIESDASDAAMIAIT